MLRAKVLEALCVGEMMGMAKDKSAFGIYATRSEVESAVNAFADAGFGISDISVLLPDDVRQQDDSNEIVTEKATKAPQGAVLGASSGAAVGGALGWLVGIGALIIPGIGPVIAAGPLVAAIAGIGIGGALGGFAGSLIGLGVSEVEARRYESRMLEGRILVVLHCANSEEIQRAREVMEITRAEEISCSEEMLSERKSAA